jgi:4-amino-4-deoxy-L-arabinose transferase-like glycosyltransferase
VLLFAVLPLNIRYAQEGRAYALAQCTSLLALWAFALAAARPSLGRLIGLGAAIALSCHVDGFGLVVPFGLLLYSLWGAVRERRLRPVLATLLIGGALAAPYYVFRLRHMIQAEAIHTVPPVAEHAATLLAERFVSATPFGVTRSSLSRFGNPGPWLWGLAALSGGLALASALAPTGWRNTAGLRLFAMCLCPALALFFAICSVTGADTLEQRYFVTLAPGLVPLLVVGALFTARRAPPLLYGLFLACPAGVSLLWLWQPTARSASDWRTLYAQIAPQIEAGDLFVNEAFHNYTLHPTSPFRAYARRAGRPIEDGQCCEYRSKVTDAFAVVRADDPSHWPSDGERETFLREILRHPNGRVWAFSGPLARRRELDLTAYARRAGEWRAAGLAAVLWVVEQGRTGSE